MAFIDDDVPTLFPSERLRPSVPREAEPMGGDPNDPDPYDPDPYA